MELTVDELKDLEAKTKAAVEQACAKHGITDPKIKEQMTKALKCSVTGEMPIYKALGISEEYMENLYKVGYNLYNAGKFKEALIVFEAILPKDGLNPRYTYSVAACYHQLKNYEAASIYYQTTMYLDTNDPVPCYYLYDCLMELKDLHSATFALSATITRCKNNPQYKLLQDAAQLNLDGLNVILNETQPSLK